MNLTARKPALVATIAGISIVAATMLQPGDGDFDKVVNDAIPRDEQAALDNPADVDPVAVVSTGELVGVDDNTATGTVSVLRSGDTAALIIDDFDVDPGKLEVHLTDGDTATSNATKVATLAGNQGTHRFGITPDATNDTLALIINPQFDIVYATAELNDPTP